MNITINELNTEINRLKEYEWKIINNYWDSDIKSLPNLINSRKNNYSILKNISSMQGIKKVLLNKLGVIPVYFFLNILFGNYTYTGSYRNIDKGLLLLYQLITGSSSKNISLLMGTYKKLYNEFWIIRNKELNKNVDLFLKNMFSNIDIRLINAEIYNPENLKTPTYIFDTYSSLYEVNRSNNISILGYATQFLCDNNGMITYVPETKIYTDNKISSLVNNDILFWDICFDIDKKDVITIDDKHMEYKSYYISNTKNILKKDINNDNFLNPSINDELYVEDIHYNTSFSEIHSVGKKTIYEIEDIFNIFKQNNLKTDIKVYNLQFKICVLLNNIKNFVNKYNILHKDHHKLWLSEEFDFPNNINIKNNKISTTNSLEQNDKIRKMHELQTNHLQCKYNNSVL